MTNPTFERDTSGAMENPTPKYLSMVKRVRTFVAVSLVVAFFAAVGIGSFALENGSWTVNPVVSGSMRPGLSVGGVVISERVPADSLVDRDVILFRSPNDASEQVVHRIIRIVKNSSGQLFINTQGDANTARDPWTLSIRGGYAFRARWSIPLLGYVAVAFQNNRGIAIIAAGVVLLAIGITSVIRSRRRDEDELNALGKLNLQSESYPRGRHLRRRLDGAAEFAQGEVPHGD